MIQYGVNLEEKNFKVMMMNNEENTTENLVIYTGTLQYYWQGLLRTFRANNIQISATWKSNMPYVCGDKITRMKKNKKKVMSV